MGCISSGLELHICTYLDENEDQPSNKGDVPMKICKSCTKSFVLGKNDCCSIECYLENLQFKIDECFRRDTSHTKFLTNLV